jgi:threonine/homoserine/homoserine lactone efflux protein
VTLAGAVLLDLVRLSSSASCVNDNIQDRFQKSGLWSAGLSGMLLAFCFCPVSAALYFGSLLPPAMKSGFSAGLLAVYGCGTALPVFVFAVLVAPSAQWVGRAFDKLVRFEKWARRVTGVIFILAGIHFCLNYLFEVQL